MWLMVGGVHPHPHPPIPDLDDAPVTMMHLGDLERQWT